MIGVGRKVREYTFLDDDKDDSADDDYDSDDGNAPIETMPPVMRALTGIAVGGALPLVYSITGDLFPKSSRTHASALVGIVSSLGSMTGQGIAGFMGPSYGWRLPFVVVAAPGLCVAFLVWRFAEEPKRGGVPRGDGLCTTR